jgi:hypothetical protein
MTVLASPAAGSTGAAPAMQTGTSHGQPPTLAPQAGALHSNSLAHGLQQAATVAIAPGAAHVAAATHAPPTSKSTRADHAVEALECVRMVLGMAKEALDACPISGVKAAVGALGEVLRVIQVGHHRLWLVLR